jgi:hypothetical protein
MKKIIINATLLSILIFLSISFIDFLLQIPPFSENRFGLTIGFPLTYYREFFPQNNFNYAWNLFALIFDYIITWVLTVLSFHVFTRKKKYRIQ